MKFAVIVFQIKLVMQLYCGCQKVMAYRAEICPHHPTSLAKICDGCVIPGVFSYGILSYSACNCRFSPIINR